MLTELWWGQKLTSEASSSLELFVYLFSFLAILIKHLSVLGAMLDAGDPECPIPQRILQVLSLRKASLLSSVPSKLLDVMNKKLVDARR